MRAAFPPLARLLLLLSLSSVAGQNILAAWSYDAVATPTYDQLMLPDVGWTSPTTPMMATTGATSGLLSPGTGAAYYGTGACA